MKLKQRIIFQKLLFILEPPIDPVNNVSISQQVYKIKQTNYWLNEAFCVSFIFHTKCDKGTANAYWLFIILINSQWWQIWLIYIYHLTNAARRHFSWWSTKIIVSAICFAFICTCSGRGMCFSTPCLSVNMYAFICGYLWPMLNLMLFLLIVMAVPRAMVKWNFDKHKCLTWLWDWLQTISEKCRFYAAS